MERLQESSQTLSAGRKVSAYIARKHAEISALGALLPGVPMETKDLKSPEDFFQAKTILRNQLRSRFAAMAGGETRMEDDSQTIHYQGFPLAYSYQRLGLFLRSENILGTIYPPLRKKSQGLQSRGFFASSCQSVISTLFQSLFLLKGKPSVNIPTGGYWETIKYLELMHRSWSESPQDFEVLYWDSSTDTFPSAQALEKVRAGLKKSQLFVIDTTCYPQDSKQLSSLLELVRSAQVPCVLVRSHMKLDSLGMEYGRLGSFVLLWEESFPKKAKAFCQDFLETFEELAKLNGVYASLGQIYPFYNAAAVQCANRQWITGVQTSTQQVRGFLQGVPGLRFFAHDLFFWVSCDEALSIAQMTGISRKLLQLMSFHGISARNVASYPWDFCGFTLFHSKENFSLRQKNKTITRISIGDLEPSQGREAASCLKEWIQWLRA